MAKESRALWSSLRADADRYHQRSLGDFRGQPGKGLGQVRCASGRGLTRRRHLHESGSLRVRFPSPESDGLSAVFVNTAGGVAGGDRFDIDIAAGEGSRLTVTTAAAEKVYRAQGPAARLDIALKAAAAAHLAWLPQETILFDRARVMRRIDIDLAESASLLLCEIVVFGRGAMGERMLQGEFVDHWRMRRGGKLVFAETVRLDGDIGEKLARPAVANGGVAIGTALIVPGDEGLVARHSGSRGILRR